MKGQEFRDSEFFALSVPQWAAVRALRTTSNRETASSLVLSLRRSSANSTWLQCCGRAAVIPFPSGIQTLAELLVDQGRYQAHPDDPKMYIPRSTLDELADEAGAKRVVDLPLAVGMAADDAVMVSLNDCLRFLHDAAPDHGSSVADGISNCFMVHLAERYGNMRLSEPASGALEPWQLRLATRALGDLSGPCTLAEVADACGLSVGHFSRAFKKSTKVSPHKWIVHRRVEAAKGLIASSELSLAEIALICCFSDQSHLTRTFAGVTGDTPARWRARSETHETMH